MLSLLIRKELLDHLLSLRFAMACIICLVVVLSGVVVLTRDYREARLDYNSNTVMHRNQLDEYDNPFNLVDDGIKVDKPLNPLKIFFRGVDEEHTATVRISAIAEPEFQSDYEKNPVAMLFPVMDLAFVGGVFHLILPLCLALLACADPVDREIERLIKGDAREAETARMRLALAKSSAIEPLIAAFQDRSHPSPARVQIAEALFQLYIREKDGRILETLIAGLADPDKAVRQRVAAKLGDLHERKAAGPLIERLDTEGDVAVIHKPM